MPNFFTKLLSSGSDKELRRYKKTVARINEIEPTYKAMTDEELAGMTPVFKERYNEGETLDDLLVEAFAVVREMSFRVLGMRHYDVQLIGAMALHEGSIAEMKTGEGKTLVSTAAGYLNALSGGSVHVVTVNDYLAKRDAEWMGQIYHALGMTTGVLQNGMRPDQKKPIYQCDVLYGTNSEFGFDYLRDNMVVDVKNRVQRGHQFAIVDEVDSILIDEARTPLIISGAGTKSGEIYQKFARAIRGLKEDEDYELDEAKHTIMATEKGLDKIEAAAGVDIYEDMSGALVNHLQQALKAQYMFHRDKNYVVMDGEVKIVDEFTGRIMDGRRYSEGLHQALEAKEGVLVREENQTLATITLQNYFRLYDKLSGMTGTAMTEDSEFREIYDLAVQAIPSNRPIQRIDRDDLIYRTIDAKFDAVAKDVIEHHESGQPVLVGTVSIESSERLSHALNKRGIRHEVLNAKHHAREASIVAQAGRLGAVTIATNMAGRGTDILLGGSAEAMAEDAITALGLPEEEITPELVAEKIAEAKKITSAEKLKVIEAGGLLVIGTERHESRRIDNQLRGRAGRQGDPGETQFYLSLEDDLMRLFGGNRMDRVDKLMESSPDDQPIQAGLLSRAVENAQHKVEGINFQARKNVLEYDDVMDKQRHVIYDERNAILDGKDLGAHFIEVMDEVINDNFARFAPERSSVQDWDIEGLEGWLEELTGEELDLGATEWTDENDELREAVSDFVHAMFEEKSEHLGEKIMSQLTPRVMLRVIDTRWMNYLQEIDYLKAGIGLRGFGQRDPLVEYREEAFRAFGNLVKSMYEDYVRTLLRIEVKGAPTVEINAKPAFAGASYSGPVEPAGDNSPARAGARRAVAGTKGSKEQEKVKTYVKDGSDPYANVGRNDLCPCGSGKKFKNCHGRKQ